MAGERERRRWMVTIGVLLSVITLISALFALRVRSFSSRLSNLLEERRGILQDIDKLKALKAKLVSKRASKKLDINNGYAFMDKLSSYGVEVVSMDEAKGTLSVKMVMEPAHVPLAFWLLQENSGVIQLMSLDLEVEEDKLVGFMRIEPLKGKLKLDDGEEFTLSWGLSKTLYADAIDAGLISPEPSKENAPAEEPEQYRQGQVQGTQGTAETAPSDPFEGFEASCVLNGTLVIGSKKVLFLSCNGKTVELHEGQRVPGFDVYVEEISLDHVVMKAKSGDRRRYQVGRL